MQVASIYTHGLQQQDKQLRATNSSPSDQHPNDIDQILATSECKRGAASVSLRIDRCTSVQQQLHYLATATSASAHSGAAVPPSVRPALRSAKG